MLKPAGIYREQLEPLCVEAWEDERNKFFFYGSYFQMPSSAWDTWGAFSYCSVGPDGKVIGYFGVGVDRVLRTVDSLNAINFRTDAESQMIFARDLIAVFRKLFKEFRYHRVRFACVCGNPVEEKYKRIIDRIGGKFVGTFHYDVMLRDGRIYDTNFYEIPNPFRSSEK